MYRIYKEFTMDCAHVVEGHKGKCAREHGHTYKIEIWVKGYYLDGIGILIDFGDIKEAISGKYDHQRLNNFPEFDIAQGGQNPTAEVMCKHFFNILQDIMPESCYLEKIRIWETPTAWAEWEDWHLL